MTTPKPRKVSYDNESYRLAQHFIHGTKVPAEKAQLLAQAIQQAVEDWFAEQEAPPS